MAAAVEEQEEASDEMVAALAAGGTFSFEPEPDEDELLPVEAAAAEPRSRVEETAAPRRTLARPARDRPPARPHAETKTKRRGRVGRLTARQPHNEERHTRPPLRGRTHTDHEGIHG